MINIVSSSNLFIILLSHIIKKKQKKNVLRYLSVKDKGQKKLQQKKRRHPLSLSLKRQKRFILER